MSESIGLTAELRDRAFKAGITAYQNEIDDAVDANEDFIKSGSEMQETTEEIGDSFVETASKTQILQDAMDAVREIAAEGMELAELGAQSERVEETFTAFASSVGDSTELLDAFQRGAGGTVDKMSAMSAASKLIQMGLVEDAETMETVVEMATRLGDQTASATDRVGDFALMLANQSIPRLDNFGISSGTVKARMEELQAETEGMDRATAFMIATIESGDKSLGILGERMDDNAAAFEKAQARMADTRVEIGQKLAPVVAGLMNTFAGLSTETIAFLGLAGSLLTMGPKLLGVFEQMGSLIGAGSLSTMGLVAAVGVLIVAYEGLKTAIDNVNQSHQDSIDAADTLSEQMQGQIDEGGTLADTLSDMADRANDVNKEWNSNIVTGTALGSLFGSHNKILETYAEMQEEVTQTIITNTGSYETYSIAVEEYNAQLEDSNAELTLLTEAEYLAAEAGRDWIDSLFEQAREAKEAEEAAEEHAEAVDEFRRRVGRTYGPVAKLAENTKELTTEMDDGSIAAQGMTEMLDDLGFATDEVFGITENLIGGLDAETVATNTAKGATDFLKGALDGFQQSAATARDRADELRAKQNAAAEAADLHSQALLTLAERLSGTDEKGLARAAIQELHDQFEAGKISGPEYEAAVKAIQDRYQLVTPEGRALAEGVDALASAFGEGIIDQEEYERGLETLREDAKDGKVDIEELIGELAGAPVVYDAATGAVRRAFQAHEKMAEKAEEAYEQLDFMSGSLEATVRPTDDAREATMEYLDVIIEAKKPLQGLQREFENVPEAVDETRQAMIDAGAGIIANLVQGIEDQWPAFMAYWRAKLRELDWDLPGSEPKNRDSPLYGLSQRGMAIVENLGDGILEKSDWLENIGEQIGKSFLYGIDEGLGEGERRVDALFDVGSGLGGVAGSFLNRYEEKLLDPAEDALDAINDKLEDQRDIREDMTKDQQKLNRDVIAIQLKREQEFLDKAWAIREAMGDQAEWAQVYNDYLFDREKLTEKQIGQVESVLENERAAREIQEDRVNLNSLLDKFYNHQDLLTKEQVLMLHEMLSLNGRISTANGEIVDLEAERAIAAERYAEAQERALRVQEAQADLDFLQSQLDLLDLIAQYGLDAGDVLGGLQLGLDADLEEVLDALSIAMQEIIRFTENELGIASESKVFYGIGKNMMAGMAMGIRDLASLPIRASLIATQGTMSAAAGSSAGVSPTVNNVTQLTIQAGGNTIGSEMEAAVFDARIVSAVKRGLRGNT